MREIQTYYYSNGNAALNQEYYGYQVEGNTVSVGDILPDRDARRRELEEEKRRKQKSRARQNARALKRSRVTAGMVIMAVLFFGAFFIGYVNLQTSIRAHMGNIATLKEDISDLKASNSAAQSRISTATDINEIKNKALNEYGMVYANEGQIVYYDIEDEDYMSRY
ncbi:MAG: hypothetical protein K6E64_09035 [Lachnospiraceae bacterium]|nr:hypothetical protein [Lachnospiraceae bacterium]